MNKKILFYIFPAVLLFANSKTTAQNAGINATGATPNTSSILDLNTGNTYTSPNGKGLLIPNVALTSTTDAVTVTSPATSLLVYNTATASAGATAVSPGYYYWDGAKWVTFTGANGKDWALLGNAGTVSGTNFLGTTDNVDLNFRANNIRSGLIDIASFQTLFGYQAGLNIGASTYNSIFGAYAGLNTTGAANSFFGGQCGQTNTTGAANTAMGYFSLLFNSTGSNNTAYGAQSLYNALGSNNTGVGINTGYSINSGSYNTALGYYAMNNAGLNNITGSYNTAAGASAGTVLTTGSYNTALGYLANAAAGTYTNSTAIGSYAQSGASDALVLGSIAGTNGAANSTKVGIGTTTPVAALTLKVPSSSGIDAIYSDVTAGNGNGNAFDGVSTGNVGYSTIYASNTPVMTAGTGFDITLSHHTIGGQINLPTSAPYTPAYAFAIHGEVSGHSNPCGGVLGYYSTAAVWGALGYRNSAGTANYGMYSTSGAIGTAALSTSIAARSTGEGPGLGEAVKSDINVGLGAYGYLFGALVRGNIYGMAVRGEKVSLYVDGKTVVNQPIVEITRTEGKPVLNYIPVSATADLQLHGITRLERGIAQVKLSEEALNQFVSLDEVTIIATPGGPSNGVYAELKNGIITIKENNNGTSDQKINWIMIGERKSDDSGLPDDINNQNFDSKLRELTSDENTKGAIPSGSPSGDAAKHSTKNQPK